MFVDILVKALHWLVKTQKNQWYW